MIENRIVKKKFFPPKSAFLPLVKANYVQKHFKQKNTSCLVQMFKCLKKYILKKLPLHEKVKNEKKNVQKM